MKVSEGRKVSLAKTAQDFWSRRAADIVDRGRVRRSWADSGHSFRGNLQARRKQIPSAGKTFELMRSTFIELYTGASDEIGDHT